MKSKLIVAAVCAIALIAIASWLAREDKSDKIIIEYWDINPGPNRTPYTKFVIGEFEKQNPQYKVKHVMPPYSVSHHKFITAIAAGNPPDCSEMFGAWLGQFAAMGALENLEPYIAQWPGRHEIDEVAWKQVRAYGSPAYMLPTSAGSDALFYRLDWFQQAGSEPPETWDEFLEIAKHMTKPELAQYGFGMRGGSGGSGYAFYFMTAGTKGRFFDEGGNCLLNTPEAVRGLQFYVDLFRVHKVTPPTAVNDAYRDMISAFYSGRTAMYIHNNGSIGDQLRHLGEGKFMTAPIPRPKGGKMYTPLMCNGYAIYKDSKVKEGAWKLIAFFASQEMNSYWCENTGGIPLNKLSQQEGWFKDNPYLASFLATAHSVAEPGQSLVHLPDTAHLEDALFVPELQKCLLGKQTPQQAADKIAAELTKAQKQWLARRQRWE